MRTKEFIDRLASKYIYLKPRDVTKIVSVVMDEISKAIISGREVEIHHFGLFATRQQKPVDVVSNLTGEIIHAPAKKTPVFRASIYLKKCMKDGKHYTD